MTMNVGDKTHAAVPFLVQQKLAPQDPAAEATDAAEIDHEADAFTPSNGDALPPDAAHVRSHSARGRKLEQHLSSPDEALKRFEQFRKSDDPEQLKTLKQELTATHKALRTGQLDATQEQGGRLRFALGDVKSSLTRMNEVDRTRKWDQVVKGADGDISSTYKAYFTHSDVAISEMREVVATAKDLANPDSTRRIHGNQVDALPRDRIWSTKMELLDGAVKEPVRNGRPLEVDAEYYELSSSQYIDKLNQAAAGGAHVRVLIDSGRLSPGPDGSNDGSSLAGRLNTLAQLQDGSPAGTPKPAVSLFANKEVLGARTDLMHRKLLRVGDDVVFGGMNANQGSGENVDFAMKIKGPATSHFVDTFRRDIDLSAGKSDEAIFGTQLHDLRLKTADVRLDRGGMRDFVSALSVGGAGTTQGDDTQRLRAQLDTLQQRGIDVTRLAKFSDANGDGKIDRTDVESALTFSQDSHGGHTPLTFEGRALLADQLAARAERTRDKDNVAALRDVSTPATDAPKTADDTLAIADNKVERQAAVLQAIDGAQRYVKVSAFVVTKDVAAALIDKRDQMRAQGKPFDVQVVLDPGLYGYGGTPNSAAYKMLEDNGVEVKWNLLDRTDPGHDRKNHSKLLITDQALVAGSTNFSKKGLRENWEMSDVTWFGENADSRARQKQVVDDFDRAWQHDAIGIDTRHLADAKFAGQSGEDLAVRKDGYRDQLLTTFLRGIEGYEREAGTAIQAEAGKPDTQAQVQALESHGIAHGYAVLDSVGTDRLQAIRESRPAYHKLLQLQERGLER